MRCGAVRCGAIWGWCCWGEGLRLGIGFWLGVGLNLGFGMSLGQGRNRGRSWDGREGERGGGGVVLFIVVQRSGVVGCAWILSCSTHIVPFYREKRGKK